MSTYLKWGVAALLLGVLAYLIWGFTMQLSRKKAVAKHTQTLPACTLQTLVGNPLKLEAHGTPTVLIYFDPDCDHCQRQARALVKEGTALANATVVMLSAAPVAALKTFAQTYQLHHVPGLQVAQIDRQVARETFGFVSAPDVLIYHANGTLSRRFKGETSVAVMARHL